MNLITEAGLNVGLNLADGVATTVLDAGAIGAGSDRTVVIRCSAHFERQPFVNEFTFYDAGAGWRLVHLRYDANLATMFTEDLKESGGDN